MTTATETELPAELDSSRSRAAGRASSSPSCWGSASPCSCRLARVFAYEQAHAGKIGAGVHVGSVDVSGLTRDAGYGQAQRCVCLARPGPADPQAARRHLHRHLRQPRSPSRRRRRGRCGPRGRPDRQSPAARDRRDPDRGPGDDDRAGRHLRPGRPQRRASARSRPPSPTPPSMPRSRPAPAGFTSTPSSDGRSLAESMPSTRQVMAALGAAGRAAPSRRSTSRPTWSRSRPGSPAPAPPRPRPPATPTSPRSCSSHETDSLDDPGRDGRLVARRDGQSRRHV